MRGASIIVVAVKNNNLLSCADEMESTKYVHRRRLFDELKRLIMVKDENETTQVVYRAFHACFLIFVTSEIVYVVMKTC